MANISHRVTYAFDEKTVHEVTELAKHWKVSKSEAVRLSIHQTLDACKKTVSRTPQEAFRILRQEQPLTPGTGMKWMQEIIKEREQDSLR